MYYKPLYLNEHRVILNTQTWQIESEQRFKTKKEAQKRAVEKHKDLVNLINNKTNNE